MLIMIIDGISYIDCKIFNKITTINDVLFPKINNNWNNIKFCPGLITFFQIIFLFYVKHFCKTLITMN